MESTAAIPHTGGQLFGALIRHVANIIAVLVADGIVRFISPAVEPVLAFRADDLSDSGPLSYVHREDLGRVRGFFAGTQGHARSYQSTQFRCRHRGAPTATWR